MQLHARRCLHIRPAECQQLTGQPAAAFGRRMDLFDSIVYLLRMGLAAKEFSPAEDHLQRVVEIVGDTASELADRIELLCVQKRRLGTRQLVLRSFSERLFGLQSLQRLRAIRRSFLNLWACAFRYIRSRDTPSPRP